MLEILYGTDWVANRDAIFHRICDDISNRRGNRILMVPELTSHDAEKRLCQLAGDTASRYAEVLTFTRLASRVADAAGHGAISCMDNGGRIVAMASAARQLHSKLKAYASVETKPEFLISLVDAVDEFKRCCISGEDLMTASKNTTGSLAQKLEELSLLLQTYDMICHRGKRDPRDQMTWLLEQLEDSTFGEEHTFYIDAFPDFTRQHMAILEYLIRVCPNVVISLNCDRPGTDTPGFEIPGATASDLISCAKRHGVAFELHNIPAARSELSAVKERLLSGGAENICQADRLKVYRTGSVYQECVAAAQQIVKLLHTGVRYRDIGVVCAEQDAYTSILEMSFHRCGIPFYLSGTDNILDKPAIATVLAALDAALGGFDQKDVLRYLRAALSPLSADTYDRLENYVYLWNISGSRWLTDWTFHPDGLNGKWTNASTQQLEELNAARAVGILPLQHLRQAFADSVNLRQQVIGLYHFLKEISFAKHLDDLSAAYEAKGDHTNVQILDQLWDILLLALEQMYDVLGETSWDSESFAQLLKLLLSQYDVGTIPAVLDAVSIGTVKAMRCQETKHLIVLGALEGSLPTYGASASVLSDQERVELRKLGLPVLGGSMDILQSEFSQIYGVFCGAQETITVSCPAGQPSFIYRRLAQMAGGEQQIDLYLGAALTDPLDAGAYLARFDAQETARELQLSEHFDSVQHKKNHKLGDVDPSNIKRMYGSTLNLSASQIDRFADCRLSYFLKYGLRAKERKQASIDPAEFGTYVHWVLENTVRDIMVQGGFDAVSLEKALEIADAFSKQYAQEHFSQLETQRLSYLFSRNAQELAVLVRELWNELHESKFVPVGFEVAFGDDCQMGAIPITGHAMTAQLRGFVDRIDAWQEEGRNYFRVVDYKTGKKDFDYCDVFNGLGLQMLLYLFALQDEGSVLLGEHPLPAGVQYFPARVPFVAADGILSSDEADAAREKAWKRKGLLLADDDVLWAMEPAEKPKRLSVSVKKDGTKSGDIANREQFAMLKDYVFKILGEMVDSIASGSIEANPYTRGSKHNPCTYCPYGAVCHPQYVPGRRDFAAMTPSRFWEEIGKELNSNG